jgi:hypothetical protein
MEIKSIGRLWYGSWKDYKKIRELYDIDIMVSICRYPPYRYYGSEKELDIRNFYHLGPSRELHRWARENLSDRDNGSIWTEYAGRYQTQIGNRMFGGNTDNVYNQIINWLYEGKNVCMLCTCPTDKPCHRFLLWNNMVKVHKVPLRGSNVKLDFPENFLDNGKITDKTWEWWAIDVFANEGRIGEANKAMLVCPHVEMSAAYDRLIKQGLFADARPYLYLKETSLNQISKGEWER